MKKEAFLRLNFKVNFEVNKSRYKQSGVTPYFSTGQNLLERILRKDKY